MLANVFADKSFNAVSRLPLPAIKSIEEHFNEVQQMSLEHIAFSAQGIHQYLTDDAIKARKKSEQWDLQTDLAAAIGLVMWMKRSEKYGADFSRNFVPELLSGLEKQLENYEAFKKGLDAPTQPPQAEVASP